MSRDGTSRVKCSRYSRLSLLRRKTPPEGLLRRLQNRLSLVLTLCTGGRLDMVVSYNNVLSTLRRTDSISDHYTRNLAFILPSIDRVSEEELLEIFEEPEIGHVTRNDGKPLEPGIPEYMMESASHWEHVPILSQPIKIIDFEQSFLPTAPPQTLRTLIAFRAPEVMFKDRLDYRVDLWSMGCTVGH